jgi:ankyrin repeat protein
MGKKADDALWAAVEDWTNKKCAANITAAIEAGANPNAARTGQTPIFRLIERGSDTPESYEALLDGGADVKKLGATLRWSGSRWVTGDEKSTVLHAAAALCHRRSALLFVARGVPIEAKTSKGRTALHMAALASGMATAPGCVDALLEAGADASAVDDDGKRPIDYAVGDVRAMLTRLSAPAVSRETRKLIEAIQLGKPIDKLIAKADPSAVDHDAPEELPQRGVAAVHSIFIKGVDRAVIDKILGLPKIDINARATDGKTPLWYVVRHQRGAARTALLKKVLAMGADPNLVDELKQTVLWELAEATPPAEAAALVDVLVEAGAKLRGKDVRGNSLLDDAFARTGRRGRVKDARGFAAYLKRLVELKTPAKNLKEVTAWIAAQAKS